MRCLFTPVRRAYTRAHAGDLRQNLHGMHTGITLNDQYRLDFFQRIVGILSSATINYYDIVEFNVGIAVSRTFIAVL